ncbi:MAG: nicotinamide-nucleotide amidohydrolase family protein, partial [Cyclobacteriaceae bacterium]|nr:nicotinamide-nucleotide amidohydrolase family protein [Cyclobacteriaceae bacterium]
QQVDQQIERLTPMVGKYIYGFNRDTLPKVLGDLLKNRGLTICSAESCTGGAVASAITSVPGSSQYFMGSVVAYHNHIKTSVLNVSPETLATYGAVSEETVLEMAHGAQKVLNADVAIATSGIAGPDGGTPEKPVGTIWMAVAYKDQAIAKKLNLFKDRAINIRYTSSAALNLVRQRLLEMDGEKL